MFFYRKIWVIGCLLLAVGCQKQQTSNDETLIILDEEQKQEKVLLSDIADNIEVITLEMPEDIIFGKVEHIKVTDNCFGLFDEQQTKSVTFFNHEGKFINQLRKIGQGPGEYANITDFTLDSKENILLTYDSRLKSIFMYSFPNLDFLHKIRTNIYLMVITLIEQSFLVVSDEDLTETTEYGIGHAVIDTLKKTFTFKPIDVFPNTIPIVEGAYPNTFTRNAKGLIYVMDSQYPVIYQIRDTEITPIATIDFVKNKIPDEYWGATDINEFNEAFSTPPLKSGLVQNVIVTDDIIAFYYMFGTFYNRQLAVYNRKTQKTTVVNKVLLGEKYGAIPYALGVYEDSFLTLLFPEDLENLFPKGLQADAPKWLKEVEKSLKADKTVCLKYKVK